MGNEAQRNTFKVKKEKAYFVDLFWKMKTKTKMKMKMEMKMIMKMKIDRVAFLFLTGA